MRPSILHPLALIIGLLTSGCAASAQPSAPTPPVAAVAETPASVQGRRLIAAASATDDAGFARLLAEIFPTAPTDAPEWRGIRGRLAQMRLHGLAAATPTHAELFIFNAEMDHWMRAVVDVDPAEPHLVTHLGLRMSTRPPDVPGPARLSPLRLAAETRSMVGAEAAAGRFDGAVLIARDGQRPLLNQAWGLADREHGRRNRVTTQFRFGSIGKLFTEVAIMQLAQAGKLDLSAPVGRYLPDYPNADIAAHVTIDELMTHSGGTGDFFTPDFDVHRDALRKPADYIALFGARGPLFPPGSRQDYSNYGFIILGRIVEVVSGLAYDEYLNRRIFAPAGMRSSGTLPEDLALPDRAVAYAGGAGGLQAVTAASLRARGPRSEGFMEYRGGPAGGGYSTVGDFLKFGAALRDGRLLDAAHLRLLTEGRVALTGGAQVGYDFTGPTEDGRRFIGHGGGGAGQSAEFRLYPGGWTVVVLANRDPPAATRIMSWIGERLP
jgi:D-alanyl-D-alanine carboxypeptidase